MRPSSSNALRLAARLAPSPAPAALGFVCAGCRIQYQATNATTTVATALRRRRLSSTSSVRTRGPSQSSSGLVALSSRRLISISGPDAPKFLQGVITQNILAPQQAADTSLTFRTDGFYGAFLTATGRVLYDVFIYPDTRPEQQQHQQQTNSGENTSFLVEVDAHEATRLEKHIKRYKLRAKFAVRLLDPGEVTVWHGWEDDSGGRAALDAASQGVEDFHRFVHMRDPRAPGLGWRMVKSGDREPLVDLPRVKKAGGKEGEQEGEEELVYRLRRYLYGVAEGQAEILREAALPLESNLDVMQGVDFRKGCYVGQELTIRTKHRGVVRKRILPVVLYGEGGAAAAEAGEIPQELAYHPGLLDAGAIPAETSIGRLGKKGRSTGKWLRGVGNVGLALCRLETMTDVVLPGETAASTFNPADEFVMEWQQQQQQEERQQAGDDVATEAGDGAAEAKSVKIKAFVPEWLRQRLGEQNGAHGHS
ncbi:hypothetical protein BD289DRAFT_427096 [Coniella lustricola]|uniref:Iron-sulfur cluster assembly factor IBA57 homolog, mitochondrial n=1 Tax=Coniella lustricola TaxID=2025994 RepID=A0A2T3AFM1_9PEZI|nr:hypothetical protein BD289DRAFT_427096 [Coniella lustricola]